MGNEPVHHRFQLAPLGVRKAIKNVLVALLDQPHDPLPQRSPGAREREHHGARIGVAGRLQHQIALNQHLSSPAGLGFVEVGLRREVFHRQGRELPDGRQAPRFAHTQPEDLGVSVAALAVGEFGEPVQPPGQEILQRRRGGVSGHRPLRRHTGARHGP